MHIAIVGSGYVGLVAGACFADMGHQVILVDNDQQKLATLRNGQIPIHEKFLPELLQRHRDGSLTFSDDLRAAVQASEAVFIAVGTPPTEHGNADLSYVESVARIIPVGNQWLQGRGREEHSSGLYQRMDPQNHSAQCGGTGLIRCGVKS